MTLWWWLSYVDTNHPEGGRHLGGTFISGETFGEALDRSLTLGVNPGGHVRFTGPYTSDEVPAEREVLLTSEDMDQAGINQAAWDPPIDPATAEGGNAA